MRPPTETNRLIRQQPKAGTALGIVLAISVIGFLEITTTGSGQEEKKPSTPPAPAAPSDQPEATEEEVDSGMLFVSPASSPKVYAPIKDAKQTLLAPAYVGKYGVRLYSKEDWQEGRFVWNTIYAAAVKKADALVDELEPDFKRDARGVLDYAVIEHESPWLSSVLLSSRFLPRFEREFGERIHVVVIDRNRLYVFPADGGKLKSYAPAMADLYHDDSVIRHPVSLEVFLVDESGIRAVGSIED